jgi:3-methyl-2-oxobutanoate hydroxymethyltransferase
MKNPLQSSPLGDVRVTVPLLRGQKNKEKIVCLTAYDFTTARIADAAGVDLVLVGDSLGGVVQGESTTLPVTLEQMEYHTRCVSKGVSRALVVADLPFMTYQVSEAQAIESSCRMLKYGGAAAVKLEGGIAFATTIQKLTSMDIPVMGHVGLTPQSVHRMGGFKVQGKEDPKRIIDDAVAVAQSGAFSLVIEGVPDDVAQAITEAVAIPTIGIGAGVSCDGQILVFHDLLGLHGKRVPKFVKQYANLFDDAVTAIQQYRDEVKQSTFPSKAFSYGDRLNG